jgi:hypothetical protein
MPPFCNNMRVHISSVASVCPSVRPNARYILLIILDSDIKSIEQSPPEALMASVLINTFVALYRTLGDLHCGLVVRVAAYRCNGPGFDSRQYQIL